MGFTLYDYQREALDAVVDHVARGARRLVLAIPTGGGKTIVFSHLPRALGMMPGEKVLILAHRDELVQQAADKYLRENPGEMVGIEKAESRATPMDRVCVASVQTLGSARLKDFAARWGQPRLIITDECHHAVADGYQAVYRRFGVRAGGDIVHVGVTATPKRSDNVGLDGTFETVAYSITMAELIRKGKLTPLAGYRVETKTSLDDVKTVAGDFNQGQLANVVDVAARNARVIQAYADITAGRRAIVFAASVQHSKHLAEMFGLAGYTAAHLDGTTADDERRAMIADFGTGKYDVLCNCAVLTEGWDEPSLEVVMIARPTKSTVLYTQMVGRATRLHPGKTKAAVIDFVDATSKHSIIALPSLLGLPPTFNLGGRDAVRTAEKYTALVDDNPLYATLITDAASLAKLGAVSEAERMGVLVRHLMEQAKQRNEYVSVNMLMPPPMPTFTDDMTYMVWTPHGDDAYRLRLKTETLTVTSDLLGKYTVRVVSRGHGEKTLGVHDNIRFAFSQAELWVRDHRGDQRFMVDKSATWRSQPATSRQRSALKKYGVAGAEKMTKHQADAALDTIMTGLARGRS